MTTDQTRALMDHLYAALGRGDRNHLMEKSVVRDDTVQNGLPRCCNRFRFPTSGVSPGGSLIFRAGGQALVPPIAVLADADALFVMLKNRGSL